MRFEFFLPLLSLLASAAAVLALLRWRALPMDIPNQRSLHQRPVPRGGGLAIWAGWGVALLLGGWAGPWLISAAGLAVLSYFDDRKGLSVAVRFPAHVLAAGYFISAVLPPFDFFLSLALVMVTVWMLNLFNFMDGSDGLAGSMAVSGFAFLAAASLLAGEQAFGLQLASLAAAALAFLGVNWSPARMFLGDVGSIPLGFLAAAMSIDGWTRGLWPWWFPLLVFLPFIADASFTLVKRAWRRERIWEAHREHAYQMLARLGLSHARIAASYAASMLAGGLLAMLLLRGFPALGAGVLLAWALLHLFAYLAIMGTFARARESRHAR